MKKSGLLISAFLLLAASSAVAQDIRYDFDKDKDFSKYKTYKWVAIKGAELPDEGVDPVGLAQVRRRDLTVAVHDIGDVARRPRWCECHRTRGR